MNAPNVRSVTVRLDAAVSKYIADMKAAGKATDDAFRGANRSVRGFDKNVQLATRSVQNLGEEARGTAPGLEGVSRQTDALGSSARRGSRDIDRFSGRLAIWRDVALTLGPSLIPLGGVAIPALTGLANQFGAAAAAAGVAVFAFQGVGEALGAVNKAALEPTEQNLQAASAAMERLSPAGRDLVTRLHELAPLMQQLRNTGQAEMFPGVIEGLEHLVELAPEADRIISEISGTLGDIAAEGGASLASSRWTDFYDFLAQEARPTLVDIADTTGSVAHGLSEMWEAFQPLNRDFGDWLSGQADDFDRWAQGLDQTQGFEDFVDYIRDNGPQVAATASAIGNAFVDVVQAVSPLGGPSLKLIETFADTVGAIADSDIGTPIFAGAAALALYNRTLAVTVGLQTRLATTGGLGLVGAGGKGGKGAPTRGGALGTGLLGAGLLGSGFVLSNSDAADTDAGAAHAGIGSALIAGLQGAGLGLIAGGKKGGIIGGAAGLGIGAVSGIAKHATADNRAAEAALDEQLAAKAAREQERLIELQEEASGTGRDAAAAQEQLAFTLRGTGEAAGFTSEQVDLLNQTTTASATASTAAFSAETSWRDALKAAGEQARSNTAGLKGNSDAALENRRSLEQLAGSWNSLSEETRESVGRQRHARRSFVDLATAMGVPIKRARQLAREMLDMPDAEAKVDVNDKDAKKKVKGTWEDLYALDKGKAEPKATLDDKPLKKKTAEDVSALHELDRMNADPDATLHDNASGPLGNIRSLMNSVDGRHTSSTHTHTTVFRREGVPSTTGSSGRSRNDVGQADGGFHNNGVMKFADGGFGSDGRYYQREPMLVPGGANILWGEKETGWEAYISGKPGQRARNIAVLAEAAERLGVTRLANGGTTGGRMHRSGGSQRFVVEVGDVMVRGTVDTPFGPAEVAGIAQAVARQEIDDDHQWRYDQGLS